MLCWAHRSHSWNNCRLLCCRKTCTIPQHHVFSKKFKVSNTHALALTPWSALYSQATGYLLLMGRTCCKLIKSSQFSMIHAETFTTTQVLDFTGTLPDLRLQVWIFLKIVYYRAICILLKYAKTWKSVLVCLQTWKIIWRKKISFQNRTNCVLTIDCVRRDYARDGNNGH